MGKRHTGSNVFTILAVSIATLLCLDPVNSLFRAIRHRSYTTNNILDIPSVSVVTRLNLLSSNHENNNNHHDPIADELLSNDISYLDIVNGNGLPPSPSDSDLTFSGDDLDINKFGSVFRQCAPYIAMHRGHIMVIHIAGTALHNKEHFDAVMDDISILHLLGVQLVLVVGVRNQVDERLAAAGRLPVYHEGMRVTDEETMKILKETSGSARFEIESSLARGFRGRPGQSGISVISGNFFFSAKPTGVRDGVDFKLTGEVRRVEVENLKKRLDSGDVVLLTSLGYSNSGEVFNIPSESIAAECAMRLEASKIIYFTDGESIVDTRTGKNIQSLRLNQAISLLDACGIKSSFYNQVDADKEDEKHDPNKKESSGYREERSSNGKMASYLGANSTVSGYIRILARCVYALSGGVRRAHLLPATRGALLKELYSRDGAGILVARDIYEGIRQATASDVRSVEEIIRPLEEEGILVPRTREKLEKDMQDCFLMTRDGAVLALGMLKQYGPHHAEIACVAVHPSYRRAGRGETLLAYLERRALLLGVTNVFVLSTRTMQWFEERGFVPSDPNQLPPSRSYNSTRGSKVYMKSLGTQRDVDAEELLWNV